VGLEALASQKQLLSAGSGMITDPCSYLWPAV